jgi:hypothetical protein
MTLVVDEVDLHICHECLATFLFESDLEDHKSQTGHRASTTKKSQLVKIEDKVFAFFWAA